MTTLKIPEFAVVMLIGAAASGKTEFAMRNFLSEKVFSISHQIDVDLLDEQFDVLVKDIEHRLQTLQTVVVDAPLYFEHHRKLLYDVAWKYGAQPYPIVFHLPISELRKRPNNDDLFSIKSTVDHMKQVVSVLSDSAKILNSVNEIDSVSIEIDDRLLIGWGHFVSECYKDYGLPASESFLESDYLDRQLDLEHAAELVYRRKASDNVVRAALPVLLKDMASYDDGVIQYVMESSKRWLPDEQNWMKAYWISLWFNILRTIGAFERWEWGLSAATFIQNIDDPQPYLVVWKRLLQSQSKPAIFHLVNTLLDHFEYRSEFSEWLKQPWIQSILENSYFRYEGTSFGDRISAAEHKLIQLKANETSD